MTVTPRNPGSKPKPAILIVEEDPDANSLIAGMIRLKGYFPLKAHSTDECIDKLYAHADEIDAAVLNGLLTMERGGMLISRIKKVNPNIKILVIAEEEGERAELMRMSAEHIIFKPISIETVIDKITNLLAVNGTLAEAG